MQGRYGPPRTVATDVRLLWTRRRHRRHNVEHISGTSRRGYSPKMSRLSRSYDDVSEPLISSGMSLTPTVALQGGFNLVARRTPAMLDDPRLAIAYGPSYVEALKAALRAPATGPFATTPEMVASLGKLVTHVVPRRSSASTRTWGRSHRESSPISLPSRGTRSSRSPTRAACGWW
jgi:hypothetical protein